jgi:hypothetical protein
MRRNNMRYRKCGRITAIVILMSFLTAFPVFGEPPTMQPKNSTESGTRLYSEYEIDTLIEDLTGAAEEAIEKAAAEAAKAAALASIEREAAAMAAAQKWYTKYMDAKAAGIKNAVLGGIIGFVVGTAAGGITAIVIGSR